MKAAKNSAKTKRQQPLFQYKNGRKTAVILDIRTYREMLERIEDAHDIKILASRKKKPGRYRTLEDVLKDVGLS